MKIGVVGKRSFIGLSFLQYKYAHDYEITLIDSRENKWRYINYSEFDLVIFAAGIAHVSLKPEMENEYYLVNRDLLIEAATKMRDEGLTNLIFLSSMIVYGDELPIGQTFSITRDTHPNPVNFYGKSKLEAEEALLKMVDENFKVTIIRLPMVYGPGCKGNFVKLVKIANKTSIFPSIENKRSMIFIDNLCAYLDYVIENKITGIVYPQNAEYVSTLQIIKTIASLRNRKIWYISLFNPLIIFLSRKVKFLRKIWGTKFYDFSLSPDIEKYNIVSFEESIKRSIERMKT